MNNKTLIEQQELVRFPRIVAEDYSEVFDTICYKRLSNSCWTLNSDSLPAYVSVKFHKHLNSWTLNRESFIRWFGDIQFQEQCGKHLGEFDGDSLLKKIESFLNRDGEQVTISAMEASCN
jgi:hypothetical protein